MASDFIPSSILLSAQEDLALSKHRLSFCLSFLALIQVFENL